MPLVGRDDAAVGEDHLGAEEVVHREPVAAAEEAAAAAEGEAGDADRGGVAEPGAQPVLRRGGAVRAGCRAGLGESETPFGVDRDGVHPAQVEDQGVGGQGVAGVAVAARTDGDRQVVVAGGADGGGDLRRRRDLGDGRRDPVEGAELDPGRVLEAGRPGDQEPVAEEVLETGERGGHGDLTSLHRVVGDPTIGSRPAGAHRFLRASRHSVPCRAR